MSITYPPLPDFSSQRQKRRAQLVVRRRADDDLRARRKAWAKGGYVGDPPEIYGDGHAARIVTADGAEIVYLLDPPAGLRPPNPAIATNDNDNADHDWRVKAGLAAGPPPPANNPDGEVA